MVYVFQGLGGQCLDDPFVYAVEQVERENDAELICSCTLDREVGMSTILKLDSHGLYVDMER